MYFFWPNFDKYWSSALAVLLYLGAIVMSVMGVKEAFLEESLGASMAVPVLIGGGYVLANLLTLFT